MEIRPSTISSFRPSSRFPRSLAIQGPVIYELPDASIKVRGTLFIAHACSHGAYDFWERSNECEHCVGLAEEVKIVRTAVEAGFIVIAANSTDRASRCWSSSAEEIRRISSTILKVRQRHSTLNLPLFGLGTSSGAAFVWEMARRGEIDGAILQVLAVNVDRYIESTAEHRHMPVVFNPMKRDTRTFLGMKKNYDKLSKIWPPQLLKFQECQPIPVTEDYFLDRLPYLDYNVAHRMVLALIEGGHIDHLSGQLMIDPTSPSSNWREIVKQALSNITTTIPIVLDLGKSPIAKALNRAWAFHEYCATYIQEDLEWMLMRLDSV